MPREKIIERIAKNIHAKPCSQCGGKGKIYWLEDGRTGGCPTCDGAGVVIVEDAPLCPNCHNQIPFEANFCMYCGKPAEGTKKLGSDT